MSGIRRGTSRRRPKVKVRAAVAGYGTGCVCMNMIPTFKLPDGHDIEDSEAVAS